MMTTMVKKKEEKSVICMFHVFVLVLAISAAESSDCTRHCGDVNISFPFGIEPDCFLPGFHVVCNSSKLYSGDIQILNINPGESRATILQKVELVDLKINNDSTGVHVSTEMDLTGSRFRFSDEDNIFVAQGCNVVGFFNTTTPDPTVLNNTGYGRSCAALCNDLINGSSSGFNGFCEIHDIPSSMQQFTSYIILGFAGCSSSPSQNSSCLLSYLVDRNSYASSGLRGCELYNQHQGQFPVAVDWTISDALCSEAMLDHTTYACRSPNSECYEKIPGYSEGRRHVVCFYPG